MKWILKKKNEKNVNEWRGGRRIRSSSKKKNEKEVKVVCYKTEQRLMPSVVTRNLTYFFLPLERGTTICMCCT